MAGDFFGDRIATADQIEHVERDQHQARNDRAGKQVGDRNRLRGEIALRQLRGLIGIAELVAEQHQHRRRREDLRQRRGRRDRAGGKRLVVAVPQHGRQHDQAHRHRRSADDAFGGGEQHADEDHRNAKAARQRAEQPAHGFQQILGDARALQHHAHEDEERDGEQHVVGHDAENALRQRAKEREIMTARGRAGGGEEQRHAGKRQRHRIAGEQQRADGDHHARRRGRSASIGLMSAARAGRGAAEHERGADRLRHALQADEEREQRDQRLEQIDERQSAGFARAFQNRPGARHIGQREQPSTTAKGSRKTMAPIRSISACVRGVACA